MVRAMPGIDVNTLDYLQRNRHKSGVRGRFTAFPGWRIASEEASARYTCCLRCD